MISAFANTLKIPELRQRILFTLAMVVIVRVGAAIPLPGVNAEVLQEAFRNANKDDGGAIQSLMNVFSGGGLQNCAVFALGIMPYISASIMMQLLTAVVPRLGKLSREDGGRSKINMYTRYVTIALCIVQGYILANSLADPGKNIFLSNFAEAIAKEGALVPDFGWHFVMVAVMTITAGTMLLMWLGEQITERGIGNGISLIIAVNIVSALPGALVQVWQTYITGAVTAGSVMKPVQLVMLVALLFAVIAGVIAITQAVRKITVSYAKRVIGRKVMGGQNTFLPLKVNYAGVMPIIFAQAILLFPSQIISSLFKNSDLAQKFSAAINPPSPWYFILSALLIFFFSYFWVATMFQPQQIAEDLKKNGGYVPGVRPGKPTATFLDYTMSRLTFAGACFLTIVAILPTAIATMLNVNFTVAQFFGGTSVLILVGVLLDIMRQAETHLIQRHYDGFLRKGKIRGRFDRKGGTGKTASKNTMIWLYTLIAILVIVGVAYMASKKF